MIFNDKKIRMDIEEIDEHLYSHSESFKAMDRKLDNYNKENHELGVMVRAILNYLNVDTKKKLIRNPAFLPPPEQMSEIIVLKKKK